MGPRGPHAIFPPDHLFVNEHRSKIIVIHAPPSFPPPDQVFVDEYRSNIYNRYPWPSSFPPLDHLFVTNTGAR